MVPVLFLLWLGWWGSTSRAQNTTTQIVEVTEFQVTEFHTVFLPCPFEYTEPSSSVTWIGPSGDWLLYVYAEYYNAKARLGDAWGLLYDDTFEEDDTSLTCTWNGVSGTNYTTQNRTGYREEFVQLATGLKLFTCDAPTFSNWSDGSLLWTQHNSLSQRKTVLINVTIWRSLRCWLSLRSNFTYLILPSVTSKDAGNYTCQWKNHEHHFQLEVIAKSDWRLPGDQHWIIWTVALGGTFVCVSSVFFFLWIQRAGRARKQQMTKRSPCGRCFYAQRKKGHISNGILMPSANHDATDDFSYENVIQDARSGRHLLQKGKVLPNNVDMEDEEEYEYPDSETELKSDDGGNYENTQEEIKHGDLSLNDISLYENSTKKTVHGSHKRNSADRLYENNAQEAPKVLTKDQLNEADGGNYENLEKETSFSSGAARLIAGLRLQLALDPHVDRLDGGSETSTGSQSYEEMNGSLSPSAIKAQLHPNTSNEEDADSYENMESPNNLISRKDGNLDRSAEEGVFNSTWQNPSIPLGTDLKGGSLCSD